MLLANIPSLVRVVREACVPSCTSWLCDAIPLSTLVTGQQREQPPHRTPKTLITALHSLPAAVFHPDCSFPTLPSPLHSYFPTFFLPDRVPSPLLSSLSLPPPWCTARVLAIDQPSSCTITCKCHACLLPLIKVVAAQFRTSDVESQRLPKDTRDETRNKFEEQPSRNYCSLANSLVHGDDLESLCCLLVVHNLNWCLKCWSNYTEARKFFLFYGKIICLFFFVFLYIY